MAAVCHTGHLLGAGYTHYSGALPLLGCSQMSEQGRVHANLGGKPTQNAAASIVSKTYILLGFWLSACSPVTTLALC